MIQALLSGVASIKADQTEMNIIGNNLANINTTAFKGSSVSFEDMVSQTIQGASKPSVPLGGTDPIQLGLGVIVGGTALNNSQGSLNATNQPTDLAIQGNGFFLVSNGANVSYTRDGSFQLDAAGNLVQSATGEHLLGWAADSNGNINTNSPVTSSSTLTIPLGSLNTVQATSNVTMGGNLQANPPAGSSWTTQVPIYNSLGVSQDITLQFGGYSSPPPASPAPPANATTSWTWTAYLGDSATGTPIASSSTAGNSLLYYDSSGALINPLPGGALNQVAMPAFGGGVPFSVALDFSKVAQLATATQVNATDQNGFAPGSLQNFTIGSDGVITGNFANGLTRTLGQVAMGLFTNPAGLASNGSNNWAQTDNSGVPVVGVPSTGGRGTLNAGFLEQSNVDIGSEFTNLIIAQRGYEANTKVVTTVDQMLQDLIAMKQ